MDLNSKMIIYIAGLLLLVFIAYSLHNNSEHKVISNQGELELEHSHNQENNVESNANTNNNDNDNNEPEPSLTTGLNNAEINVNDNNPEVLSKNPESEELRAASCFPKNQLTPSELLPQDNHNEWAKINPQGVGTLKDRNFLQSGHHIGINTVGQTLRNPNLQLRSEPPNPQAKVSPWLQSTIDPDIGRKPFEIGGCA